MRLWGWRKALPIGHGDDLYVAALCPQAVDTAMIGDAKESSATLDGIMQPEELAQRTYAAMQAGQLYDSPTRGCGWIFPE